MGRSEDPLTWEEYEWQIWVIQASKSIFDWVPYIMLMMWPWLLKMDIKPDYFDATIAFIWFMAGVINTADWFTQHNLRPTWMDWIVFSTLTGFILLFKIGYIYRITRKAHR